MASDVAILKLILWKEMYLDGVVHNLLSRDPSLDLPAFVHLLEDFGGSRCGSLVLIHGCSQW